MMEKKEIHPLLRVKGLRKYFPIMSGVFRRVIGQVRALDGVDFDLAPGEILGIVGESGSGKSTLGRTILRLIEPTAGQLEFEGQDLLTFNPKELQSFRKEAQIVFQDPYASLNPRKTIGEAIGEGIEYHGIATNRSEVHDRVVEILKIVGISPDAMRRYPHQFSGGQQQRICIGRALALSPRMIVCDEAVSALDVSVQAQILNLLQKLRHEFGLSFLFISHDLSVVRYLCDKVLVLYLGKVMERASVNALYSRPCHPYTQALLSAIPKSHPQQDNKRILLKGEVPSAANPPSGCPFRTRCPYAEPVCAVEPPVKIIEDPSTGRWDHEYHCIL